MNTQDFYAKLVTETNDSPLFAALHQLTLLDDPRAAFSGDSAVTPWTAWYASVTEQA